MVPSMALCFIICLGLLRHSVSAASITVGAHQHSQNQRMMRKETNALDIEHDRTARRSHSHRSHNYCEMHYYLGETDPSVVKSDPCGAGGTVGIEPVADVSECRFAAQQLGLTLGDYAGAPNDPDNFVIHEVCDQIPYTQNCFVTPDKVGDGDSAGYQPTAEGRLNARQGSSVNEAGGDTVSGSELVWYNPSMDEAWQGVTSATSCDNGGDADTWGWIETAIPNLPPWTTSSAPYPRGIPICKRPRYYNGTAGADRATYCDGVDRVQEATLIMNQTECEMYQECEDALKDQSFVRGLKCPLPCADERPESWSEWNAWPAGCFTTIENTTLSAHFNAGSTGRPASPSTPAAGAKPICQLPQAKLSNHRRRGTTL